MTSSPTLNVAIVARAINIPVSLWPGRCHEIATACYRAGCVPRSAKVRYGVWHGPIADTSELFGGRGMTHHGWVELANGRLYDPTRWVFEDVEPYIWTGDDPEQWYDMGGNALREHLMDCSNPPAPLGREVTIPDPYLKLFARYLSSGRVKATAPANQLIWLGSLPLQRLGDDAARVYKALIAMRMSAAIPIDNRQAVLS